MGVLDGKVALILGAARGQGRAEAETFAREGADIIAFDIARQIETMPHSMGTPEDLSETVRLVEKHGRRVLRIQGDVRSQSDLDGAVAAGVEEFGKIDILIANQGAHNVLPFWKVTDEMWYDVLDVNLTGTWRAAKAIAPHMIERGQGVILMTGSVNGVEVLPGHANYVAAKAGLIGFAKNVAFELGQYNIRCNIILPGAIDTLINWPRKDTHNMPPTEGWEVPEDDSFMLNWTMLKDRRWLPTQSIADAMLFLASDAAQNITGVVLPVDAGHLALPGYNGNPFRG